MGIEVCGMAPLRGAESLSQTLSLLRPTHTKVSSAHKILRDYYTIKYNLSTYLLRSSPRVRESSGFSYLISHSHATNSYSYSAGLPVVTLHSSFRLIRRRCFSKVATSTLFCSLCSLPVAASSSAKLCASCSRCCNSDCASLFACMRACVRLGGWAAADGRGGRGP
eukprot:COSAG02_NODE_2080_length_9901_cov_103.580086_2_plen_166_part_00